MRDREQAAHGVGPLLSPGTSRSLSEYLKTAKVCDGLAGVGQNDAVKLLVEH